MIDAQYFSKKQIGKLKKDGHVVYSYINPGSIEEFRPYYHKYEKYALDAYENWDGEYWMDVSAKEWQNFCIKTARKLQKKGIDGLFVDNADVYYHYPTEDIFHGMTKILKSFHKIGLYVVINGGDVYVSKCAKQYKTLDGILDGVNQETVYSKINWEKNNFGKNKKSERKYFQRYAALVKKCGKDVYFLEYTKDKNLKKKIQAYCTKKGYRYYIADSIELSA